VDRRRGVRNAEAAERRRSLDLPLVDLTPLRHAPRELEHDAEDRRNRREGELVAQQCLVAHALEEARVRGAHRLEAVRVADLRAQRLLSTVG